MTDDEHGFWIAVASAEHVVTGVKTGFCQVCHGKGGPLRRLRPLDRLIYYSPTKTFGGKDRLRQFTAYGIVRASEPYQVSMSASFHPYRRDVDYLRATPAAIAPLIEELDFTRLSNWGWKLRAGLVQISAEDGARIARAMKVSLPKTKAPSAPAALRL